MSESASESQFQQLDRNQQNIKTAIAAFKDIVRDLPHEKQHTLRNIQVLDALEDYEELLNDAP